MSTLNFPDPSASPWTAPNGVTYIWDTDGEFWDGSASGTNLDQDFLKLNATNSPVTGDLQLTKTLTVNQSLTVDQDINVDGSITTDGSGTFNSYVISTRYPESSGISVNYNGTDYGYVLYDQTVLYAGIGLDGSITTAGGVTSGGDNVIETGSLNVYQSSNSSSSPVFNGGWNAGSGRNITSTINSDGSITTDGTFENGKIDTTSTGTNDKGVILDKNGQIIFQLDGTISSGTQLGIQQWYGSAKTFDVTNDGNVTANSFIGDGSNLSGIKSGTANFVASGTIAKGAPVIINSDGTVSSVKTTSASNAIASDPANFGVSSSPYGVVYCPDIDRVVCLYYNSSTSEVECRIGIVEENADRIRWGSVSTFPEATMGNRINNNLLYDTVNNKLVFVYTKTNPGLMGRDPKVCVGEIDVQNDKIVWGTPISLMSNVWSQETKAVIDTNTNKIVVVWNDGNSGGGYNQTYSTVCTVSAVGGELALSSTGSRRTLTVDHPTKMSLTFNPIINKVVIASRSATNGYGAIRTGSVNHVNNSFSFDSSVATTFNVEFTDNISTTYDSSKNKTVLAYESGSNPYVTKVVVVTINDQGITFGTDTVLAMDILSTSLIYDPINEVIIFCYSLSAGGLKTRIGTIWPDGGIALRSEVSLIDNDSSAYDLYPAFAIPAGKSVLVYAVSVGGMTWNTISASESNLNTDNYIGLAAEAISDGANGNINIVGGINEGQSGQNVSKKYYVKASGTISDIESYPLILAGTAISSTKMIVKG